MFLSCVFILEKILPLFSPFASSSFPSSCVRTEFNSGLWSRPSCEGLQELLTGQRRTADCGADHRSSAFKTLSQDRVEQRFAEQINVRVPSRFWRRTEFSSDLRSRSTFECHQDFGPGQSSIALCAADQRSSAFKVLLQDRSQERLWSRSSFERLQVLIPGQSSTADCGAYHR